VEIGILYSLAYVNSHLQFLNVGYATNQVLFSAKQ